MTISLTDLHWAPTPIRMEASTIQSHVAGVRLEISPASNSFSVVAVGRQLVTSGPDPALCGEVTNRREGCPVLGRTAGL